MIPQDLRYTKEHEWVRLQNGVAVVGITHFAQDQLGDIVFTELPQVGKKLDANGTFGVVESVKTVSDLFAPLAGEVIEVNAKLTDQPELINQDPYGEGWMIKIKPSNPGEAESLLDAGAYAQIAK